jgi:hypothetical protein
MKTRLGLTLALVVFFIAQSCGAEQPPNADDRVVARISTRVIRYSEIRCPESLSGLPERCVSFEKAQLDRFLIKQLVSIATVRAGIVVTDQDVLATVPTQLLDEDLLRKAAQRIQRITAAVVEVKTGGDADLVYQRQLNGVGISRAEFDQALRLYSLDDARRVVRSDIAAGLRARTLDDYRYREQLKRLNAYVEKSAEDRNVTYDQAEALLWKDVLETADVSIEDPRYTMPELRGIL